MSSYLGARRSSARRLLHSVFPERAVAPLIVLRNAEELPDGLSGHDLDVAVLPGSSLDVATTYLCDRAATVGWKPVCYSPRNHMSGVSFVDPQGTALHFDVFLGISVLSIPLLSSHDLLEESVVIDGTRRLTDRGRVAATVLHHIAWSGSLGKQKYRDELAALLTTEDREWFIGLARRAYVSLARRMVFHAS